MKRKNKKIWIFVLILFVCGFVFIIGGIKEVLAEEAGGSNLKNGGIAGPPPAGLFNLPENSQISTGQEQVRPSGTPTQTSGTPAQTGIPTTVSQLTTPGGVSVPRSPEPPSPPRGITDLSLVGSPNTPGNPQLTTTPYSQRPTGQEQVRPSETPTSTGIPPTVSQLTTPAGVSVVPRSPEPPSPPSNPTPVVTSNLPNNFVSPNPPSPPTVFQADSSYSKIQPNNSNLGQQSLRQDFNLGRTFSNNNPSGFDSSPYNFNNQPKVEENLNSGFRGSREPFSSSSMASTTLPPIINQQIPSPYSNSKPDNLNLQPSEQNFKSVFSNNPSGFNLPPQFNSSSQSKLDNQLIDQPLDNLRMNQITISSTNELLNPNTLTNIQPNFNNIGIPQQLKQQDLNQLTTTIKIDSPTISDIKTQPLDNLRMNIFNNNFIPDISKISINLKLNNQILKQTEFIKSNILQTNTILMNSLKIKNPQLDLYRLELLNNDQLYFTYLLKDKNTQYNLEILNQNKNLNYYGYIFEGESVSLYFPKKTILLNKIIDFLQYSYKDIREECTLDYFDIESLFLQDIPDLKDENPPFISLKI